MNLFTSKKDLYEFKQGTETWYFTSSRKTVTHNGNDYLPLVVARSNIEDEDIDKCDVDVIFPYPKQLLNMNNVDLQALFIGMIYFQTVTLTVLELYKGTTMIIHSGRIVKSEFDEENHKMRLVSTTAESYQRRNILTRKFQRNCSNKIYDKICGLNINDWLVDVTVTNVNTTTAEVLFTVDSGSTYLNGYFTGGLLYKDGIYVLIQEHYAINGIIVDMNYLSIAVGDTLKLAPLCEQSINGKCDTLFNNSSNFMGFPSMPNSNPVNDLIVK